MDARVSFVAVPPLSYSRQHQPPVEASSVLEGLDYTAHSLFAAYVPRHMLEPAPQQVRGHTAYPLCTSLPTNPARYRLQARRAPPVLSGAAAIPTSAGVLAPSTNVSRAAVLCRS